MKSSHRQQRDVLRFLGRTDKWYLGGGDHLIWAPPFPQWLETPGFWDKANFFYQEFAPIFTWTFFDDNGQELTPVFLRREWRPDRLQQWYRFSRPTLELRETRCVLPGDVLISECEVLNHSTKPVSLDVLLWTCHESSPSTQRQWLEEVDGDLHTLRFLKMQRTQELPAFEIACVLGILGGAKKYAINFSQRTANFPRFAYTPFYDYFPNTDLANTKRIFSDRKSDARPLSEAGRETLDGLFYFAHQTRLRVSSGDARSIVGAAAFHENLSSAVENYHGIKPRKIFAMSQATWQNAFEQFPQAALDDDHLDKYFAYREYGLRLMQVAGSSNAQRFPAICEGVDYFHLPISYSAFCHMREMRWARDPAVAQGSLRNFAAHQLPNGRFPGRVYPFTVDEPDHYHADWGGSLLALHAIHPNVDFLREVYPALCRLQEFYDRERDPEGTGLYDMINHYETGQEYMRRYQAVNPQADVLHWGNHFRLKGVDLAIYQYRLKQALAITAGIVDEHHQAERWKDSAAKTGKQILELMWDPQAEMFFDLDTRTMKRTGVPAAVCFYPYMTDVVTDEHLRGLKRHLFDPEEFWTPFPVPSTAVSDPSFSAFAEWKEKRHNCPWNGRVWPMTNSHIAECLGVTARRFQDDDLRHRFVEFFSKYIMMMFDDGDPAKPNCFEHYNPFSGRASRYRGVDDYQHSWILDLYMQYVFGIHVSVNGEITIDPFPFGLRNVRVSNVPVRGHLLDIAIQKNDFTVMLDHRKKYRGVMGQEIHIQF